MECKRSVRLLKILPKKNIFLATIYKWSVKMSRKVSLETNLQNANPSG